MPETVARYFYAHNITDIELTREDAEPDVQQVDPCYRNNVNIMNYADGCTFSVGDEITFEGVADDLGSPIAALELSFDDGRTWTTCETTGATADKWVNWQFSTSFDEAGDYRMTVRARSSPDDTGVSARRDAPVHGFVACACVETGCERGRPADPGVPVLRVPCTWHIPSGCATCLRKRAARSIGEEKVEGARERLLRVFRRVRAMRR